MIGFVLVVGVVRLRRPGAACPRRERRLRRPPRPDLVRRARAVSARAWRTASAAASTRTDSPHHCCPERRPGFPLPSPRRSRRQTRLARRGLRSVPAGAPAQRPQRRRAARASPARPGTTSSGRARRTRAATAAQHAPRPGRPRAAHPRRRPDVRAGRRPASRGPSADVSASTTGAGSRCGAYRTCSTAPASSRSWSAAGPAGPDSHAATCRGVRAADQT